MDGAVGPGAPEGCAPPGFASSLVPGEGRMSPRTLDSRFVGPTGRIGWHIQSIRMPDGCVGACFLVDITCSVPYQPDSDMKAGWCIASLSGCVDKRLGRGGELYRSVHDEDTSRPADVS